MAYLKRADIANLGSIRRSLISVPWDSCVSPAPTWPGSDTLLTDNRGDEFKFSVIVKKKKQQDCSSPSVRVEPKQTQL